VVTGSRAGAEAGLAAPLVQIDAWQPDRPYLELYDGKPTDFAERFREAEARHGTLPIFYLDTAAWLSKRGQVAEAQEMVLSALELPTADDTTLGMVADRLERYGAWDRAVELRERQAALDPDRPQPRRLLALTLARRAKAQSATARADLTRAIALLYDVAITPQSELWEGIALISLNEANAMLPRLRALGGIVDMDPRLVGLLDVDVRVVIDWTSDGSDMDLWVDEPTRERAIYNNNRTVIGGRLSNDMTRGYGPEEYMVHMAPAGIYTAQANVFAPDRIDPNGATILTAHLFRNFGRANETVDSIDIELKRDEKGARMIGRVVVPAKQVSTKR
jgi:tetratricopeptide (TPR) repeat protein